MKFIASIILGQDFVQMKNQHKEDKLKKAMLFDHKFKDEEVILWLKDMFASYEYPNEDQCVEIYNEYKNDLKNKNKRN
jgi:hypothetical protein